MVPTSRPASFDQLDGSLLVLAQHIGHGDLLAAKESRGKSHHDADDGNGCHHGGDDLVLVGFGLFDLVGAGGARNRATGGILAAHARDGTHHGARLIGKLARVLVAPSSPGAPMMRVGSETLTARPDR